MRTPVRLTATLAVAVLALAFTGCGSNNTGKIVGKWKVVSSSSKTGDLEKMKSQGMAMGFDFRADGTVAIIMLPADDKPESKSMADLATKMMEGKGTGKYTLGAGDRVTLSGIQTIENGKDQTASISINGDNMTMKDSVDTMQLTRVK
jgi:hypothetical protein